MWSPPHRLRRGPSLGRIPQRKTHHRTLALPKTPPYGIRPKTIWIGEDHAKGYLLDDFTETFHPYIPKAEARAYIDELRQRAPKPRKEKVEKFPEGDRAVPQST